MFAAKSRRALIGQWIEHQIDSNLIKLKLYKLDEINLNKVIKSYLDTYFDYVVGHDGLALPDWYKKIKVEGRSRTEICGWASENSPRSIIPLRINVDIDKAKEYESARKLAPKIVPNVDTFPFIEELEKI